MIATPYHAGHTKQGMAERLAVAEDRLARIVREDAMRALAEAKLALAQADFHILELQVLLFWNSAALCPPLLACLGACLKKLGWAMGGYVNASEIGAWLKPSWPWCRPTSTSWSPGCFASLPGIAGYSRQAGNEIAL